jgi:DNA replication and repair protein RecF
VYVRALRLVDFRTYEQVEIGLEPGVTTLVGPNGQGKTNVVEAVGYLSTLGSHRVAADGPLVRTGADRATIGARVVRDDREVQLEVEINPGKANRARLNRSPLPRARDLLGQLRTVVFAPEDLALVKGDPSERRRFLDDLLVQLWPRLAGTRADYDRIIKQRNALLKSAGAARRADSAEVERTLSVWDDQLATVGAELSAARVALVASLRPHVTQAYAMLAGGPDAVSSADVSIDYVPSVGRQLGEQTDRATWREALIDAVAARRREELDRGVTLVGPHRDDLALALGDLPVKGYASHGEAWSTAVALRLASFEVLRADHDDPVLILDDVFAELDADRRTRLAARAASCEQVLITAAVDDDVPTQLRGRRLRVGRGRVDDA